MLNIWLYSFLSVAIISLISFIGLFTLSVNQAKLKKILIYFVSFSTGALFGDAFIHLIPGIVKDVGFTLSISLAIIAGISSSFIIEKIIHWHHWHFGNHKEHIHPFALVNLWGDSIHNLIDGIIIGSSYLISLQAGLATTIAVIFHEIPQEIGDFSVLLHAGMSRAKALFYNFLSAITAMLGLLISLFAIKYSASLTLFLIPFSAGNLIYIAGSDLIPELHKEVKVKKSIYQLALFLFGILTMLMLLRLE